MKLDLSFECPLCGDTKNASNKHTECGKILREQRKATKKARALSKKQIESASTFFTKF